MWISLIVAAYEGGRVQQV